MAEVEDQHLTETAREVRKAVVRLARRLRTQRQGHGVTNTGVSVLSQLYRHHALTPSALAQAERVTPQTLTRVLAALEERGLIARRGDPSDGRQSLLELTPAGIDVLRSDSATREEWLAAALETELTPAEQAIMRVAADLIDRIADA